MTPIIKRSLKEKRPERIFSVIQSEAKNLAVGLLAMTYDGKFAGHHAKLFLFFRNFLIRLKLQLRNPLFVPIRKKRLQKMAYF